MPWAAQAVVATLASVCRVGTEHLPQQSSVAAPLLLVLELLLVKDERAVALYGLERSDLRRSHLCFAFSRTCCTHSDPAACNLVPAWVPTDEQPPHLGLEGIAQ